MIKLKLNLEISLDYLPEGEKEKFLEVMAREVHSEVLPSLSGQLHIEISDDNPCNKWGFPINGLYINKLITTKVHTSTYSQLKKSEFREEDADAIITLSDSIK